MMAGCYNKNKVLILIIASSVLLLLSKETTANSVPTPPKDSSVPTPSSEEEMNLFSKFKEVDKEEHDMVANKVRKLIIGWRNLDHEERNKFKTQVEEKKTREDRKNENYDKDTTSDDFAKGQNTTIYNEIDIYSYYSYLYYYPTMQWHLDRTPETNDYWVGIYKKGANDRNYITYQWLYKTAQGSYYVGQLSTTSGLESKRRNEKFELRLFKGGYRRVDATSNILHGVVYSPPAKIDFSNSKLQENEDDDEPHIHPKLRAFISAIQFYQGATNEENEKDMVISQNELVELWSGFSGEEQQLLFPILEQDCLPDEIKKPQAVRSEEKDERPEPLKLYPNLGREGNPVLTEAVGDGPKKITLTIVIDYSYTYVYPVVETRKTLSGKWSWVGIYRSQKKTEYPPNGYISKMWQWVGPGYKKTTKFGSIKEYEQGPTDNLYLGPIFDWNYTAKAYKQIGFSSHVIVAAITATPAKQKPNFLVDFNKHQALIFARLSKEAYNNYDSNQKVLKSLGFTTTHHIYDYNTDTNGFIAWNLTTVVVAFRGTSSINNFKTDGRVIKKKIDSHSRELAHGGFIDALNSVYSFIEHKIKCQLGNKKLFITGHSLGGALASLLAFRLSVEYKTSQPILYAYGCPAVGDKKFSTFFKSLHSYIITVPGDPVSNGLFTILAPWAGLYKPLQEYYLPKTSDSINPLAKHKIAFYIEQLEELQSKKY